jgi:hypothetical protein
MIANILIAKFYLRMLRKFMHDQIMLFQNEFLLKPKLRYQAS